MHHRFESTTATAPTRRPDARRCLAASLCLLLAGLWPGTVRAADTAPEYAVKTRSMVRVRPELPWKWPASAFPDLEFAALTIGVLGDDPFGGTLEQLAQGVEIGSRKSRKIVIKRSHKPDDLKTCQMVFVCKSEKEHLQQVIDALERIRS